MTQYLIRGLDLRTGEAWDEATFKDASEARAELERLRKARGPWRDNPIVHALLVRY